MAWWGRRRRARRTVTPSTSADSPCSTVAQSPHAARSASSVSLLPGTATNGRSIADSASIVSSSPLCTLAKSPTPSTTSASVERSTSSRALRRSQCRSLKARHLTVSPIRVIAVTRALVATALLPARCCAGRPSAQSGEHLEPRLPALDRGRTAPRHDHAAGRRHSARDDGDRRLRRPRPGLPDADRGGAPHPLLQAAPLRPDQRRRAHLLAARRRDRDTATRKWGEPHIYGDTDEDMAFGAGYVTAEDRLAIMELLRALGRAEAFELLGTAPAWLADAEIARLYGYTEEEFQARSTACREVYGQDGAGHREDPRRLRGGRERLHRRGRARRGAAAGRLRRARPGRRPGRGADATSWPRSRPCARCSAPAAGRR